jgi:hypothetical protein
MNRTNTEHAKNRLEVAQELHELALLGFCRMTFPAEVRLGYWDHHLDCHIRITDQADMLMQLDTLRSTS